MWQVVYKYSLREEYFDGIEKSGVVCYQRKTKVNKMKCQNCNSSLRKIEVAIEGAEQKAISYQCSKCDYVEFEEKSAAKVVKELKSKETPLKIKQKIIKLSQDRLGMYFNKHIVDSLELKAGEEIQVSVPDKNHIILRINNSSVND